MRNDGPSRRTFLEVLTLVSAAGSSVLSRCSNPPPAEESKSPPGSSSTLELEPLQNDQRMIRVHSKLVDSSWQYRIPEATITKEGFATISFWPTVEWTFERGGEVWFEWRGTEADAAEAKAVDRFGLTYIGDVRHRVAVAPTDYGASLEITVHNMRPETLHRVSANPCLGYPTSSKFHTHDMKRTFVKVDGETVPTASTDRGTGDPIRTFYRVRDGAPLWNLPSSFWGPGSRTVLSSGAICRVAEGGTAVIGTVWASTSNVKENCDAHQCIHSVAYLGDLEPDESRTVRGALIHLPGDERQFFERVEQLGLL